jgi:hypothetical protein
LAARLLDSILPHGKPLNVGVILGSASGGLTDVDLDCSEAIALAKIVLPKTGAIFGRQSKPESHFLYYTSLATTHGKATLKLTDPITRQALLEVRIGGDAGAQTVFPGSVHESGEDIEWAEAGDPARADDDDLLRHAHLLASLCLMARYWPIKGGRHDAALIVGGFLSRCGCTPSDIKCFVECVARIAGCEDCEGRSTDAEDAANAYLQGKNAFGYPAMEDLLGKAVAGRVAEWLNYENAGSGANGTLNPDRTLDTQLDEMNEKYFVAPEGGKTFVIAFECEHGRRVPVFMKFADFGNLHMNKLVEGGNKKIPLGKWWLTHPQRRQYAGLTFDPGNNAEVVDEKLNLWRGWGVQPRAGDWNLMREHIRLVLASGDQERFEYIMRWLAWAVQNPGRRAEVALVLKGKQGTGKGTLGNCLMRLFGQHSTHVSNANHLIGKFNAHLRDTCFLFGDECYFPGNKEAEGNIKRMLTEPTLLVEGKGRDAIVVPNFLRVLLVSNEAWIVPAGEHERRYFLCEVSDVHMQDEAWFKAISDQLEHGGYEAMLLDLMNYELGDWHPRRVPRNSGLLDQQARSLPALDSWWVELLENGTLVGCDPDNPSRAISNKHEQTIKGIGMGFDRHVTRPGLFDQARSIEPRLRSHTSDHVLGAFLRDQGCNNKERVLRRRGWSFPPLLECRKAWEERFPGWKWRNANITEWQAEEQDENDDDEDDEQEPPLKTHF